MFEAKVIADSRSPSGVRLVTMQATYPRPIHAEFMTHRAFGRNSASTRAIMLKAQITNLALNPFVPREFGTNQKGMQPAAPLTGAQHDEAVAAWLRGRDRALTTTVELMIGKQNAFDLLGYTPSREYATADEIMRKLDDIVKLAPKTGDKIDPTFDPAETDILNVHKQLAGRGLETYMWHTVVFTFTEIDNFLNLRDHPEAQGEIQTIARLIREALEASTPVQLGYGEWHTPFASVEDYPDLQDRIKVSAARCAAVSYNRQDARVDLQDLRDRHDLLVRSGHMSPLEHQARPFSQGEENVVSIGQKAIHRSGPVNGIAQLRLAQMEASLEFDGNLRNWHQYRKDIVGENVFVGNKG